MDFAGRDVTARKNDKTRRLVERALADQAKIPLSDLLVAFVDVAELRDVARRFGVNPKGYRIDKAPARVLATSLCDPSASGPLTACIEKLTEILERPSEQAAAGDAATTGDADDGIDPQELQKRVVALESQLADSKERLEKMQVQVRRSRERADDLSVKLAEETERGARTRARIEDLVRQLDERPAGDDAERRSVSLQRELHELQRDHAAILEAEEGLRRLLSARAARVNELEGVIAELEPLIPTSEFKRRRMEREARASEEPERVRVPLLTAEFYDSLQSKDRRSVEQAVQALLHFCTEGPSYPGLEVKQLAGIDLWSMRAAIKLRIYFRFLENGDIEVLELADREDQNTILRKRRDRS